MPKTVTFHDPSHDHTHCRAEALEKARAAFDAKGLKLTPLRQRVFEVIAGSHHAVGAYDVLGELSEKGKRLAPISVYRALDALMEAGVIHRLESRNAYFACHATHGAARQHLVLVCEGCGDVAEVAAQPAFGAIEEAAKGAGFQMRGLVVEVTGQCGHCRASSRAGA